MSKALMIQGTGSGVGKSLIVTGLCRIFRDIGIKVAPFKAQNMALNSFITKEGGEIGRAQALQAEAAGIEPCNDMNPILLKAAGESGCQVILNGKVHSNMKAQEYYAFSKKAWETVKSAYDRLSNHYDLIVIEGAGSPAEINLQKEEIVNMRIARYAGAPVILVGDIDKGGVFASLYGTVELLKDSSSGLNGLSDADYIKAFIVNKFRGDINILRPGLRMIEDKTKKPVIGVLPYISNTGLAEEDGLALQRQNTEHRTQNTDIRIVVVKLQYISNFTDFDPLMYEPDVELLYSLRKEDINTADLIIIPGSKNTVKDLLYLEESGMKKYIESVVKNGVPLIGICGGYQMLGKKIYDPFGIESNYKEIDGIGLLDIETTIEKTKITSQVEAELTDCGMRIAECGIRKSEIQNPKSKINLKGYEIHMGITTGDIGLFKIKRLCHVDSSLITHHSSLVLDGSSNGNVWGTYIHGIFDNDVFRTMLLNTIRQRKGLPPKEAIDYAEIKEEAINKWADILRNSIDICFILRQLCIEHCKEDLFKDIK